VWFRAVRARRAVPGSARCRVHFTRRRLDLARCMARVGRSHVPDAGKSRLDIGRNSSGPLNDCYGAKPTYSCRRMSFCTLERCRKLHLTSRCTRSGNISAPHAAPSAPCLASHDDGQSRRATSRCTRSRSNHS
jgi:hypothetical protein